MLSRADHCIFVHIPKTGGQSVEQLLLELHGASRPNAAFLLQPNENPALGPPQLAHLTASEYVRCGYVSDDEFERLYKFSFVRNPWDRIVSCYRYSRANPRRFDFKTYLFEHLAEPAWTRADRLVMPQVDYLYDATGQLLVDFVGRFETLTTDFERVCSALNLRSDSPLPHANSSSHASRRKRNPLRYYAAIARHPLGSVRERRHILPTYVDYYDDESRDHVARLYSDDIEAFGYAFPSS